MRAGFCAQPTARTHTHTSAPAVAELSEEVIKKRPVSAAVMSHPDVREPAPSRPCTGQYISLTYQIKTVDKQANRKHVLCLCFKCSDYDYRLTYRSLVLMRLGTTSAAFSFRWTMQNVAFHLIKSNKSLNQPDAIRQATLTPFKTNWIFKKHICFVCPCLTGFGALQLCDSQKKHTVGRWDPNCCGQAEHSVLSRCPGKERQTSRVWTKTSVHKGALTHLILTHLSHKGKSWAQRARREPASPGK